MKLKIGNRSGLRYFNRADVDSWNPCYKAERHLPKGWRGTALTILDNDNIPSQDRLWVVLRNVLVSEKLMRLFAVWCARKAIKLLSNPDPSIVKACDVAERFANGQATGDELSAANSAANYAAYSAAYYAANSAAYYAANYAAYSAAYYAANSAAYYAANSAAYYAANSAQVKKLREMVVSEGLERVAQRRVSESE
jgi:hypothetical protein